MLKITIEVAEQLIKEQFPEWSDKKIRPVAQNGHDNRTFHLGEDMTMRLPSGPAYVAQVEKELTWLPYLSKQLSYPISSPIAAGKPSSIYPYPWSVNHWLTGVTLNQVDHADKLQLAKDLAAALKQLQHIDASKGPMAGEHNFYRGGDLSIYNSETQHALQQLSALLPVEQLSAIWHTACASKWTKHRVWVHGDIAPSNLLMRNGKLAGIIDFGMLGAGDPACDYAMAWTYFDQSSRSIFLQESGMDQDTWNRARGWALWKALITYQDHAAHLRRQAHNTINEILSGR